jgi:hypothetical protein
MIGVWMCVFVAILSLFDLGGGVLYYHTPDLFSAVLEVPVFTVAGGGSLKGCLTRSVRRHIGIYPRLFHSINHTCILTQDLVFQCYV